MTLVLKSNSPYLGDPEALPGTYPMDMVAVPYVGYGLRRLRRGYAGPAVRVRRSSGGEQDIGFTATGALDIAALLSFAGSGSAFVSVLYDQSGQNFHAVQAEQACQPAIVTDGAAVTVNGHPSMRFDGADDHLDAIAAYAVLRDRASGQLIVAAQPDKSDAGGDFAVWIGGSSIGTSPRLGLAANLGLDGRDVFTAQARVTGDVFPGDESLAIATTPHGGKMCVVSAVANYVGATVAVRVNGTQESETDTGVSGRTTESYSAGLLIGARISTENPLDMPFEGCISEVWVFADADSKLVPLVERNLMASLNVAL